MKFLIYVLSFPGGSWQSGKVLPGTEGQTTTVLRSWLLISNALEERSWSKGGKSGINYRNSAKVGVRPVGVSLTPHHACQLPQTERGFHLHLSQEGSSTYRPAGRNRPSAQRQPSQSETAAAQPMESLQIPAPPMDLLVIPSPPNSPLFPIKPSSPSLFSGFAYGPP